MSMSLDFPSFDDELSNLNQFILSLVKGYKAGEITSWDMLDEQVKEYFTPARMDDIESKVPGWKKMASYSDGITLTHVICVFLGLFMLPEFMRLSEKQKQIAKWIVLFHDIDKFHIRGKKDTMHAFRSGVIAANVLPKLGFPAGEEYPELIRSWSDLSVNAFTMEAGDPTPRPDNSKLPGILRGIDRLFGVNMPASLIVKTVVLHISLDVDPLYPTPSPMTDDEIRNFISLDLFPLLRVMMLSDNEGWSLFDPEIRKQQYRDTKEAFERLQTMIA